MSSRYSRPVRPPAAPDMYTSGEGGELVATLPVPVAPAAADHRVIYSVEVPNIRGGDVLDVDAGFEVTSELAINVMLGSYLLLCTNAGDVQGAAGSVELTDPRTENFHRDREHHLDRVVTGRYLATTDLGTKRVNLVGYSGSQAAVGGETIVVEPGYGRVNVLRSPARSAAAVGAVPGAPVGLSGAGAATRYVGGTASGAPTSGSFLVGDFVVDQTGTVRVCVAAGSPGTWVPAGNPGDSGVGLYRSVLADTTFTLAAAMVQIGATLVIPDPAGAVSVDVEILGTWELQVSASARQHWFHSEVGISFDAGGTWDTGQEQKASLQETGNATTQINSAPIANSHTKVGTPTGAIHVRVRGKQSLGVTGGGRAERIVVRARVY